MTHNNLDYQEHQLKRWMRPDAHRFVRPDWRRFVRPGFERDHPFALYERKYRADQPRMPAGDPAGGQWTSDGSSNSRGRPANNGRNDPRVISDATPNPVNPGAQYAQLTKIEFHTSAFTGIQRIDDTTVKLANTLARVIDVVDYAPDLGPTLYGTLVHTAFAAALRLQQLPGVDVEPTFGAYYGAKGSLRPDAVLRNDVGDIVAIYDVKTGKEGIDPIRAARLRLAAGVGNDVPILVMHVPYGIYRKSIAFEMYLRRPHFALSN